MSMNVTSVREVTNAHVLGGCDEAAQATASEMRYAEKLRRVRCHGLQESAKATGAFTGYYPTER